MSTLRRAVWAEWLKCRRARLPLFVAAAFSIAPLVSGLFMLVLKDPEAARSMGLVSQKAQLTAGTADWPSLLALLAQSVAMAGSILFAFVTSWVFGREFADRTVRDLLAIPTPRWTIVAAKSLVVAALCAGMSLWVLALGLAVGTLVGLPGASTDLVVRWSGTILWVAALTILLQSTTAWVASAGRGYLAPVGFAILMLALAQIVAVLGWGGWFPWAIPALVSGAAGPPGQTVGPAGPLVVAATSAVGLAATLAWWRLADQTT